MRFFPCDEKFRRNSQFPLSDVTREVHTAVPVCMPEPIGMWGGPALRRAGLHGQVRTVTVDDLPWTSDFVGLGVGLS